MMFVNFITGFGKDFFMWGVFRRGKGNTGGQMTVAFKPRTVDLGED